MLPVAEYIKKGVDGRSVESIHWMGILESLLLEAIEQFGNWGYGMILFKASDKGNWIEQEKIKWFS